MHRLSASGFRLSMIRVDLNFQVIRQAASRGNDFKDKRNHVNSESRKPKAESLLQ
jgi:hypothetical protein